LSPDKSKHTDKNTNFIIERYRTNNADAFWKISAGK
jgi:hypothetical protein